MRDARAEFMLREEHIKLLRRAYVDWQDCETGAPEIDPKRPYGNSNVAMDVAEILSVRVPDEDEDGARAWREWEQVTSEQMLALHYETDTALQVILATGGFVPGLYRRKDAYSREWQLVKAAGAEEGR